MTTSRGLLSASLLLALALCQAGVSAQDATDVRAARSERPPLTVAVSVFAGLESEPTAVAALPPEQGRMSLAFGYNRPTRRSQFEIAGSSIVPYSSGVHQNLLSLAAGLRFAWIFGRGTRLEATQSISERPLDLTGLLGPSPGIGASGGMSDLLTPTGGLTIQRELRQDGGITLSHALNRRSSAVFSFTHTLSDRVGVPRATSQLAAARLDRRLSASSVFYVGYGLGVASFASVDGEAGTRHDINLGVSFERPLPFSGRTLFSAGTGSTVLTDGRTHQLRLLASGSLSRDLGHAWSSRIAYSRPMQYVAGFRQPFLSDALSLSVNGRLGPAWLLSLDSGVARGSVGLATGSSAYDSYNASVRLRKQLTRAWGLEAEAFAMHFAFPAGNRPVILPSLVDRHGVRAGISWSTPGQRR